MPRLKSANFAVTALASGINNSDDEFEVDDASAFPSEGPFMIIVHDRTPGFAGVKEIMEVGSINKGTNMFSDVLRGREGTSAVAHNTGNRVECVWTAGTHGELADKIHNLIDTTNHPVSGLTTGHFLKATGADSYAFQAHGLTNSDVGLSNVTNDKQATKSEFDSHLSEEASQTNLGHVKVDGETITASNGVISAQTQIVDTVTSDKWKWGMENGIVFLEKVVV